MKFFSCLRMPVDINTWRAAVELFGNVSMGSSILYLTKCFRCILYSILLLIIILLLLFTLHFYDKDLSVMGFLFLHAGSIYIKGSVFSKFSNKCCTTPPVRILFGDTNPDPDPSYSNSFSFCHWNLNSITPHNFIKMSLLEAYNAMHRFDIICLSETYLDNYLIILVTIN